MSTALRRVAASVPVFSLLVLLAGCGGMESRVRNGLVSAGLSEPLATCMAKPMARDLSIGQLRKLSALGGVGKMDVRNTSYNEVLHKVRALNDPEILRVTTTAAVSCAIGF